VIAATVMAATVMAATVMAATVMAATVGVATSAAAVLIVAVITFAMRVGMIQALSGRTLPPVAERTIRNVGPAVLTALAVNLAAVPDSGWPYVGVEAGAGLVAAATVGWWRRNLLLATLVGMSAVWVVAAFG
jgi:branched-subunit amino acid transport protein